MKQKEGCLKIVIAVLILNLAVPSLGLSQPSEENDQRSVISTIWGLLGYGPDSGNATPDAVAGIRDSPSGDRPGGSAPRIYMQDDGSIKMGEGYDQPEPEPETPPRQWSAWDPDARTDPRVIKLRARMAARHAKKNLKVAQKLARAEKKAVDEQAAMAAGAQQSSGCFPRGIRVVMADGSARSIADVKPGDVVMTYDIGYDEIVGKTVAATYSVQSNHLYTVNSDLKTTGGERLLTQSGWKPLMALTEGDLAHVNGRMTGVDTIEYKRVNLTTYNLQVNDTHNFYVETGSGNAYLVHNCGGGGK
jgi:hypothetical protein